MDLALKDVVKDGANAVAAAIGAGLVGAIMLFLRQTFGPLLDIQLQNTKIVTLDNAQRVEDAAVNTGVLHAMQTVVDPARKSDEDGSPVGAISDATKERAKQVALGYVQQAVQGLALEVLQAGFGAATSMTDRWSQKIEARIPVVKAMLQQQARITAQVVQAPLPAPAGATAPTPGNDAGGAGQMQRPGPDAPPPAPPPGAPPSATAAAS